MEKDKPSCQDGRRASYLVFVISLAVMVGAFALASLIQRDWGRVEVTNVIYQNYNGIPIRAKLLRPVGATKDNPMPGIVHIHGYQNNRETGDAYCIELARRGFVVLNIDAIGRGNSGMPNHPDAPDFDRTYGGLTSLKCLRSLPFVNPDSVGLVGHNLGAEMVYHMALEDPGVKGLVLSGFAYTLAASEREPKNMLMIIGKWDEFRKRMTGTTDIEKEWMKTAQTRKVIPYANPKIGVTYGDFARGTARRVYVPRTIHFMESHDRRSIAEMLQWMKNALHPPEELWVDPEDQIWPIKEWATLVAMLACFASLLPLGSELLRTKFFTPIQGAPAGKYASSMRSFLTGAGVNALLMWLYLPLILVLFGFHVYVIPIDKPFPMMMVNGIVWWFFWINVIGFLLFRLLFRKKRALILEASGLSYDAGRFRLDGGKIAKTILAAAILFAFAYTTEHLLEQIFIVDFRFLFPFASDLTLARASIFLRYFPFILVAFLLMGIFLHGQLRSPATKTRVGTFVSWSLYNLFALVTPLALLLAAQYVPLFTTGNIPFAGPGGMFVSFVLNLFHIIGVLFVVIPVSTWFYQITGRIYLGALLNALIVTWMFVSSQVVAPIPV
jgi:dienelactone hydrolase